MEKIETFYPEVYYNNEIGLLLSNWKKVVIEKNRPVEPLPPKLPDKIKFPISEIIGLIIFLLLIVNFHSGIHYFLIGLFLCLLGIYVNITDRRKYPVFAKDYERKINIYLAEKESFTRKLQEFEVASKSNEFLNSLKHTEVKNLISNAIPANTNFSNPLVGKSEANFFLHLNKWFGNTITQNRVIEVFNYDKEIYISELDASFTKEVENAYVPDFYFKHPTINLNIDIEVDEPYSLKKSEPIHNLGNLIDTKRNKYFTEKKWFVIRFSEEQILLYPNSCCSEIAELIYDYVGDEQYISKMISIPSLQKAKKWSYNECIDLIKLNWRNNYNATLNTIKVFLECLFSVWDNEKSRIIIKEESILFINKQGSDTKYWIKKEGIFSLVTDKFGRHLLHISWVKGEADEFIISSLIKGELIITNIHTRHIEKYNALIEADYTRETYDIINIKEKLSLQKLEMCRQFDSTGNKTQWVSHWDKERRIRVTMHEIVMKKIKANMNLNTLVLLKEIISANSERAEYIRYIVSDKSN